MKLKEKLAFDAVIKWLESGAAEFNQSGHPYEHGFIAGFEKAREMAQNRFTNKAMVRPKNKTEPSTFNTVVVNSDRFEFTILEDFQNLGEDEV